jgi:hypothetical protein
MRIKLPTALVPPRRVVPNGTELTRCSLTLATLDSIDSGVPFHMTRAADIASYRTYFHNIPSVL